MQNPGSLLSFFFTHARPSYAEQDENNRLLAITMNTVPTTTPDVFGPRIWVPRLPTCSSGSSGPDSDALSDISLYRQPPSIPGGSQSSPRHTQDMVSMGGGINKQTTKESEAVVMAVGSEQRIKEYVTKARRDTKAATRLRSVTIREMAILVST